jgi:thiamine-monophosphate kinase
VTGSAGSGPRPGPADPPVAALGEDGLVASVVARFPGGPGLLVGPGDDAAVLAGAGPVVVSTDTLVEGHDFRQEWSSAYDVGVKTAAQNFADIAAMGGRPTALLVSLALPAGLPGSWAVGLADGLADECARAGAVMAGGDVSEAAEIVVTGTALGSLAGAPVLRSGAGAGDVVALAGVVGPSAAGWALLAAASAGSAPTDAVPTDAVPTDAVLTDPVLADLVDAHRRPAPPYPAGPRAALAGATAMIDTSDGLLRDAARIAAASGVTLDLSRTALTPGADLVAAARVLGVDPLDWVLTGGEDHALLACFPPTVALPPGFRVIGRVLAGAGEVLVDGAPRPGSAGWTHF